MAEYIEREALCEILENWRNAHADVDDEQGCGLLEDVICEVDAQTAADVAPVVHAEWLEAPFEPIWPGDFYADGNFVVHTYMAWKCSRCGRRISEKQHPNKEPYCHCGAKMDGGEE